MPELPEMQALAERLDETLRDSILERIEVIQFSALKTFAPSPESLEGQRVEGVSRCGKYLVFDLGGPRLLIHLSQGGRVVIETPAKATRPKYGVARLRFRRAGALLVKEFGTQRKAGIWLLAVGEEGPLERLGPEPFSEDFERWLLTDDDGRRLHTSLRDQRTVAGIGRGFLDDILHAARLSPFSSLKSLSESSRRTLLEETRAVLHEATERERKREGGLPDKLPGRFSVHGRAGEPCPRCGAGLKRVSFEDHEIVYCATCQTNGKVLADRRLSRLIK